MRLFLGCATWKIRLANDTTPVSAYSVRINKLCRHKAKLARAPHLCLDQPNSYLAIAHYSPALRDSMKDHVYMVSSHSQEALRMAGVLFKFARLRRHETVPHASAAPNKIKSSRIFLTGPPHIAYSAKLTSKLLPMMSLALSDFLACENITFHQIQLACNQCFLLVVSE